MTRTEELENLVRTLAASEAHLKVQNADLLAMLESYLIAFDNEDISNRNLKQWLDDTWIPQARAAIAKAKGE